MLSPGKLHAIFSIVTDLVLPTDKNKKQKPIQPQRPPIKPRPVSWHPSTSTSSEKEQIDSIVPVLAGNPIKQHTGGRRGRELPPLPEGEHDVAARSRIRNKVERRRSRSQSKRYDVNPTQSMRSSRRRDSSVSSAHKPQLLTFEETAIRKQKNRQSSPLPAPAMATEALKKLKQHNRRSAPLPSRLPIIPASPAGPLFRDPWLEDAYRELTGICQPQRHVFDNLVSPKTKFTKPALLSKISAKAAAATCVTDIHVLRRWKDISYVPVSATKHSWNVFIDDRAPPIQQYISVLRRPSSGWLLDTPTSTMSTFAGADASRQLESREWNEDFRGSRHFNASGFWIGR